MLYYRQGTDPAARHEVGRWTRALEDVALASGGRWYLPYQPHATHAQFARGYPRAAEYFALKRRVDPASRFTNTLWDVYAPDSTGATPPVTRDRMPAVLHGEVRLVLDTLTGYQREQAAALLTHPEWDLVYTSDAYTDWLAAGRRPSGFPYAASVGTFWRSYWGTYRAARTAYDVPIGLHVMLAVIGTSTALEYGIKAAYENTIGRLTEFAMPSGGTAEDRYAAKVAGDYGRLIHVKGWYEFSFANALRGLWTDVPLGGPGLVRKLERRAVLSAEYGIKAVYATLIGVGTQAGYVRDRPGRYVVAAGWSDSLALADSALAGVRRTATLDRGYALLAMPRYDPYRDALTAMGRHATTLRLAEASGCEMITLVASVPGGWTAPVGAVPVLAYAIPVDPQRTRVLLRAQVRDLLDVLGAMRATPGVRVEHVYDY